MHADDRLPMAKAYQRATRGVTVAVSMVIPGMLGYWLDSRLGTRALFTILGFALGMTLGMIELIRMAQPKAGQPKESGKPSSSSGVSNGSTDDLTPRPNDKMESE